MLTMMRFRAPSLAAAGRRYTEPPFESVQISTRWIVSLAAQSVRRSLVSTVAQRLAGRKARAELCGKREFLRRYYRRMPKTATTHAV
jgi:hypothetical protein